MQRGGRRNELSVPANLNPDGVSELSDLPETAPPPAMAPDTRRLALFWLALVAVLVGIVGGLGAFVFRVLIGFFHNLSFRQSLSGNYDANLHTDATSPVWLPVVVLPVAALAVTWMVRNFAPEAKGHGVPEVLDAIYFKGAHIRPIVVLVKALASSITIGSGGSAGREGPIVQIGSAFGSLVLAPM